MAGHMRRNSDELPAEYYENPLHSSAGGTPNLSRGTSFREAGSPRMKPPAMYGLDLDNNSYRGDGTNSAGGTSASSSHCGSPLRKVGGSGELVKKLVRLNTNLRHQMELEGWAPAADTDGILTEQELLEAARAQGVLKRTSNAWKWTALAILGLVGASFGIMLGLVIIGGVLTKEVKADNRGAVLQAYKDSQVVANIRAETAINLVSWTTEDPLSLVHMDRLLLTANDGTVVTEKVATVLADYENNELFIRVTTGGWIWVANETIRAVNLNYYTWQDGQVQWKGNPKNMGLGKEAGAKRRLQQIGNNKPKDPLKFHGTAVVKVPSATARVHFLLQCKGNKYHVHGIPGCA